MLKDLLVLDLANEDASFCSKLLADLGAKVIKIEGPEGDPARRSADGGVTFFYHNTNKSGVVLDVKARQGKESLLRLIRSADVLIESFRPGSLESIDMQHRRLRCLNPRLIHVSITGFGQSGPRRAYRFCDLIASAFGGQMYVPATGYAKPVKPFGPQSCYTASLFGAIAVLLGLRKRKITGNGCHFDLSVQEAVASTLDSSSENPREQESRSFSILRCKDGYIQIPVFRNRETLLELMDSEGISGNPLEINSCDVIELVERWTKDHTKQELFQLGQEMRFPWAPIESFRDVLGSPQLKARGFFVSAARRRCESGFSVPALPYKFNGFCPPPPRRAPRLGEHTRRVLQELNANPHKSQTQHSDPAHSVKNKDVLEGIRVIDFTRMISGPYATRILADFGAEVLKIQSRLTAQGAERNDTLSFHTWNRNKRSFALDLSRPEARTILLELVAISDVVVENFSPRVLANWGLGYERLKRVKPDLIMASISAMGQTGPWRDFVGFAPTFHALSGITSASSRFLDEPSDLGHAYADAVAGLYAALAILACIENRDITGRGQYIDLSAYEATCTLVGPALMRAALNQLPDDSDESAPCGCYRCAGDHSWCAIAVRNESEWHALCRISGLAALKSGRFSTLAGRKKNRTELEELINRWTTRHTAGSVVRRLQRAGVAAGVVQSAADLVKDPQLTARRFFFEHPALGSALSSRSALWPREEKPTHWKAAPLLGEDNRYVLIDLLGHQEADVGDLMEQGIIDGLDSEMK